MLTHRHKFEPIESLGRIWNFIRPAIPDTLCEVDEGLYEARWWKPVPQMDIEILKRTDGVAIEGIPFEPADLPDGVAVQFRLVER